MNRRQPTRKQLLPCARESFNLYHFDFFLKKISDPSIFASIVFHNKVTGIGQHLNISLMKERKSNINCNNLLALDSIICK
jgi:hypothetical protein